MFILEMSPLPLKFTLIFSECYLSINMWAWIDLLSVSCPDIFSDVLRLGLNLIVVVAVKIKFILRKIYLVLFSSHPKYTLGIPRVPLLPGVFPTPVYLQWEDESWGNSRGDHPLCLLVRHTQRAWEHERSVLPSLQLHTPTWASYFILV